MSLILEVYQNTSNIISTQSYGYFHFVANVNLCKISINILFLAPFSVRQNRGKTIRIFYFMFAINMVLTLITCMYKNIELLKRMCCIKQFYIVYLLWLRLLISNRQLQGSFEQNIFRTGEQGLRLELFLKEL